LEIFSDVIQRPTFSKDELDKLRPILLARISRIDERWSSQMQKFFRGKFFIGSPYRILSAGSKEVVEAATTDRIAAYHRRSIRGGSSVLAIYGNFDAAATKGQVEKLFAGLSESKVDLRIPASRSVQPDGELHVLETKKEVSAIVVAAPGMKIDNMEDRFAITVLDTIISGYHLPGGWLHDELRGKQLVYVVHAYNWVGLAPGAFVTYAASQPDKAPQVIEIIRRNLARAAQYRPTQREIDLAVNAILTAELLDNQSMAALSMSAALDELYGFGYDFRKKLERHYREVKPEDVERVGKKYLSGGFVVTVTTPRPEAFQPPDQGSK
jgi:zinc protease